MGAECYLTVSMKQVSLLFQSTTLVSELCPQAENVDECVERLPVFWGVLSPIIFPEHYSHMCDDMECDDQSPLPSAIQPRLPGCDECTGRVNAVTDYLGHDDVISDWVTALVESEFGPWLVAGHEGWVTVEECQESLPKWLPLALKVLVKADRSWVGDWCSQFGSC